MHAGFSLKTTIVLTTAFLACTPKPHLVSKHGVMFYFEKDVKPWKASEIDQQTEYLLSGLAALNRPAKSMQLPSALSKLRVTVVAKPFTCLICPNPTQKRAGILNNKRWAIVADMGCPFNSAYTHEVLHFLQLLDDYEHKDASAWKIADSQAGQCEIKK